MEVILKEDVLKLGHRGEVVKVAEGYGRNYLLPHKLAIEATTANRAVIEQMKQSSVRKSAVEKTAADALAQQLDGTALSFQRKVGEKDHLCGNESTFYQPLTATTHAMPRSLSDPSANVWPQKRGNVG